MFKNRMKAFSLVALLVLSLLALSLLTSCTEHVHSWSQWETHDGIESRHCLRCGEIETNGGTTPPSTTPGATTPGATTPPATTPGATTPPATTPEATTPPVTTPEATTPPVTTPEATTPPTTTPEATTPPVTTPEATTPPVTTPEATTPPVTTPEATTPPTTTPEATTPPVTTPEATTPPATTEPSTPPAPHEHSYGEWSVTTFASCTAEGEKTRFCSCGDSQSEPIPKTSHVYGAYISDGNATCTADGTKTATCVYCPATDVKTDVGSMTEHTLTTETTVEPSCSEQGRVISSCASCDYENIKYTDPTGHSWNADAPTCTVGVYCTVCDEIKAEASGHHYVKTASKMASCTEGASETYTCSLCSDSYTDTLSLPKGHSIASWGEYVEVKIDGESCKVYHVYTAVCSSCSETVTKKDGPYDKHTLSATILPGDEASCSKVGYKTFTCSVEGCGHSYKEEYTDANAHNWENKSSDGGVTLYECACGESKRVIDASGSNSATVDSSTLGEVGAVELEDATIELDSSTTGALSGDVNISADTVEPNTIPGMNPDLLEQIGDNKVYNFGMTANGADVHQFEGKVTVRIPYELAEGEDPDCIAIWYIDDEGKVSTYEATYSNSFAVFETDHFSYYTVTRLSAEERCALYGHSWDSHFYGVTCVSDGYTMSICLRCGESKKENVIPALGHSMQETTTPASCAKPGETLYRCQHTGCSYSYSVRIPALGHAWQESASVAASCTKAGYTEYTCAQCEGSYRVTTPQLAHAYTQTVTAPTCTKGGYTTSTCSDCGHSYIASRTAPLGHTLDRVTTSPSCTENGYEKDVCSVCHEEFILRVTPSAHTWDIDEPTCGRGQKCTVCGENGLAPTGRHDWNIKLPTCAEGQICIACGAEGAAATGRHSWNISLPTCSEGQSCTVCGTLGAPATGAHLWDIDAPTCVRGQICLVCQTAGAPATGEHTLVNGVCSVCGEGNCTHSYTATVTAPSCTVGGYTTYTCSACGHSYTGSETAPLGHSYEGDVCSLCGNERAAWGFYAELLKSILSSDGQTLRLTDFEGIPALNGRRIGFSELLLGFDKNGKLVGYGTCDVYDAASGEEREDMAAILLDGVLYVMASETSGTIYMKIDFALLSGNAPIFEALSFLKSDVIPLLLEVIDLNAEAIGTHLASLADQLFVRETLADGTIRYTADPVALRALIETLRTSKIGDLLGESGKLALESLPDVKISALLGYIETAGFTVERLLPILDQLALIVSGGYIPTFESFVSMMLELPAFDLEALLSDEAVLEMSLGDAISAVYGIKSEEIKAMVDAYVKPTYDLTIFELLASIYISYQSSSGPNHGVEDNVTTEIIGTTAIGNIQSYTMVPDPNLQTFTAVPGPSDKEYSDKVNSYLADYDANGNPIGGGMIDLGGMADSIADMLASLAEALHISFRADASGKLIDLTVSSAIELDGGATLAIIPGMHTELDYDDLKAKIMGYVDLPFLSSDKVSVGNSAYEISVERDENGKIISITATVTQSWQVGSGYGEVMLDGGIFNVIVNTPTATAPTDSNNTTAYDDKLTDENGKPIKPDDGKDENLGRYYEWMQVTERTAVYDLSNSYMMQVEHDCGDYLRLLLMANVWREETSYQRVCYYDKMDGTLLETVMGYPKSYTEEYESSAVFFYNTASGELIFEPSYRDTMHEYVQDKDNSQYANACGALNREIYICQSCGDTRVDEWKTGHMSTITTTTLVPGATSCLEGVIVRTSCQSCGETIKEYIEYEHFSTEVVFHGSDVPGLCEHHKVTYYGCVCGQSYWDLHYEDLKSFNETVKFIDANGALTDRESGAIGKRISYGCPDCDFTITFETKTEKNGCTSYETNSISFAAGDQLLLPILTERYENGNHRWQTEATLLDGAKSCNDGVCISSYCLDCGMREKEYVEYWHADYCKTLIDLSAYGFDGEICLYTCACGEFWQSPFLDAEGYYHWTSCDHMGGYYEVYRSDADGSYIAVCTETIRQGCYASYTVKVCFDYNTKDYSYSYATDRFQYGEGETHSYAYYGSLLDGAKSCYDGIRIYYACVICGQRESDGEEIFYDHCDVALNTIALDGHGVALVMGCLCGGMDDGKVRVEFLGFDHGYETNYYYTEDGTTEYECYSFFDEKGEIVYRAALTRSTSYDAERCLAYETKSIYLNFDPDTLSGDAYPYHERYYTWHENTMVYVTLVEGASDCYGGVLVEERCPACQKTAKSYTTYWHEFGILETIDLTQYGASEGELYIRGCACGANGTELAFPGDLGWYTEEQKDENGKYCYDYVLSADGYRIRVKYEESLEGCFFVKCRTVLLGYDLNSGSYRHSVRFVESRSESHDLIARVALKPGASDCLDGVTVTQSCTRCDYSYSYETTDHVCGVVESYDLSDYGAGSACGGRIDITRCACGYSSYFGVIGLCELGISGSLYTDDGAYGYIYSCAVTDPACTFRYAFTNNETRVPGSCQIVNTLTLYIGCDFEGKNAQKTVVLTQHYENHNWDKKETLTPTLVPCLYAITFREYCLVCDETAYTYTYPNYEWRHEVDETGHCTKCDYCSVYTYNDDGILISYNGVFFEVYGDPNTEGAYTLQRYTDEERYMAAGDCSVELYRYRKIEDVVGGDGWNSESSVTYTYHHDKVGECYRECHNVAYDCGKLIEDNTWTEGCCGMYVNKLSQTVSRPTCTQPGLVKQSEECALCGYAFYEDEWTYSPNDHYWWVDTEGDGYVCLSCGLKNQNGVSGDLVLEELEGEDADEIRIGIWKKYWSGGFSVAVGAKLHSPMANGDDEVYLSGFAVEVNETFLSLSRSAVEQALADQFGLSSDQYDIRITFIGDGLSDYGITLN